MASILVVDDEPDIRYLTQVNLELDGHRVMTAASGKDALVAAQVEQPDVILLDVLMPDMDGWEVLEQLKAHLDKGVSSVKVLMMTGLGDDNDRVRGGIQGAIRYLVKPVSPDALRDAVNEVLAGGEEREMRRKAQTGALTALARMEAGDPETDGGEVVGPRLSRLEHVRPRTAETGPEQVLRKISTELTDKQRELIGVLAAATSVSSAAAQLGVSRSNVYASLRRVARKLDLESVPELLRRVRAGQLVIDPATDD